uniref:Uncharacterized protein n=1 Tax=Tanacetum cinerariifolium TaxID=118510 RepID=A0A6L2L515_TANCI|nr:hypothetical protein [Tanacetum cinerariifolium]
MRGFKIAKVAMGFVRWDEAVYKELGDSLVRAATIASSLEAEQDSGKINKIHSKAIPNESSSQGTDLGGGPRCQEAMRDTIAQTKFESVSKISNDSVLARGNTLQSDKDRLEFNELMALSTNLQTRVLDLEKTKTTQSNKIASLKKRVKKLEKKKKSRAHKLKRLYKVGLTARVESLDEESLGEDVSKQGRIESIDQEEDITLVNVQDDAEMFDVDDLGGEETSKPKVKGIVIQEQEVPCKSTTTSTISKQQSQDTSKAIMIKELVKLKKKDQIRLDEEAAKRLQGEFDEEERLARERELKKNKKPRLL